MSTQEQYVGVVDELTKGLQSPQLDEYLVLAADYSHKLEDKISEAVEAGWQIVGPVTCTGSGHSAQLFCATMKKSYTPKVEPEPKPLTAVEKFRENQNGS